MKKIVSLILVLTLLSLNSIYAADKVKFYADMQSEFTTMENDVDYINFVTESDVSINDCIIPANALIKAEIKQFHAERRWHKSGFIICHLIGYSLSDEESVDVSDEEIYFIIRKHEKLDKKEAGIIGTELVLTQAASIVASCFVLFAPVDIAYFFAKGAIKREKHSNWFKSGVMEAYDNSIFWFQLKGKPIELAEGDRIKLQSLPKDKADKISNKIEKRKSRNTVKSNKSKQEIAVIN